MKKIIITLLFGLILISASAQVERLVGPRIGITFVTAGSTADFLHEGYDYVDDSETQLGQTGSAFTTQYGWQWETRFADGGGNVVGLVEWIALVAGMEKGRFLPSVTSVIGARTADGWEFGVGPTLALSGVGMVMGFGKNFKSGNLNLPVNIVYSPGKKLDDTYRDDNDNWSQIPYEYSTGARISLMVGFNLSK